jgi:hypothetical protein
MRTFSNSNIPVRREGYETIKNTFPKTRENYLIFDND